MSGFGSGGGGFGGGFNNNNSSNPSFPFQQQPQQQTTPQFGMASTSTPVTGSHPAAAAAGFGGSQQPPPPAFGASSFASAAAATPSAAPGLAFGSSPNIMGGGFPPAPSTGTGAFGSSAPPSSMPGSTSFGTFGTPSSASSLNQNNQFPTTAGGPPPFGTSSTTTAAANSHNPFGPSSSSQQQPPGTTMSFGMSSNVVASGHSGSFAPTSGIPTSAGFGGGTSGISSGGGMGPFGRTSSSTSSSFGTQQQQQQPPSTTTFATPVPTASFGGFLQQQQQPADDDGMADDDDDDKGTPASNLPFGQPVTTATWSRSAASPFGGGGGPSTGAASNGQQSKNDTEEKLAMLKAKLAEKVRKREEKKKREATEQVANQRKESANALRAEASAFVPSSSSSQLAQRNAERFASSRETATRSQLPADLLSQSNADAMAANNALRNAGGRADREHLENAVSLIGTCEYMCPDEELLRREGESDIQLLERPVPDGKFHPAHWTLRDTMVKRFRRSAADYKLDVPEWIRPPDVLERVCGYLEEWVMERDRQGPDPRYKGVPPPPLDVYQFIWDRTRMVRKDFILQNYVGTGGHCDARAVRCHERIARWHCMCEHQLSHIPDFVTMQSQQNIQELGQAMKTLNQYYDDSLSRSLVEVPDENGQETRTDLTGFDFGCQSDLVQGISPVDFDGSSLANDVNSVDVEQRLIGKKGVYSPHHGTAEPEMRGLYLLLTCDNDGGMEVLKYAARLFQDRPEVYHSAPVQLALSIYKAKNDLNYARFFSILRSDSTPYLFACLMYKHVEYMRRYAIIICSRSYGGKSKDNEALYDTYPLQRLTHLLCFEDDDETRAACRHYNIAVGDLDGVETIFWRKSKFREPKDPDKGSVIPLRPRKMTKVIEGKLKGATRLAVCRGEVSGEESFLSTLQAQARRNSARGSGSTGSSIGGNSQARAEALLALKKKEDERMRKMREEADARQRQEEVKRKEAERLRLLEQEKLRRQEERKRQIQMQEEREREKRLEKEREELRAAQEKEAARMKAQQEERQRQAELERQEAMRRKEEERLRAEQERMRREEEERKRQELIRQEAERRRLEILRQQEEERKRLEEERLRREEERKRREAEAYRLQQEQKQRVEAAKKRLLWQRLVNKTRHLIAAAQTKDTLLRLKVHKLSSTHTNKSLVCGPLGVQPSRVPMGSEGHDLRRIMESALRDDIASSKLDAAIAEKRRAELEVERIMDCAQRDDDAASELGTAFAEKLRAELEVEKILASEQGDDIAASKLGCIFAEKLRAKFEVDSIPTAPDTPGSTFLFKIAVLLPWPNCALDVGMVGLIRSWMKSRLDFDETFSSQSSSIKVRAVFVDGSTQSSTSLCDAALLVIPPPWSDSKDDRGQSDNDLKLLAASLGKDVPRVVLALSESFEPKPVDDQDKRLFKIFSQKDAGTRAQVFRNSDLSLSAVNDSLLICIDSLVETIASEFPLTIEMLSIDRLFYKCVNTLIWVDGFLKKWEDLADHAEAAILAAANQIDTRCSRFRQSGSIWPSLEFAVDDCIPDYFGTDVDLPRDWALTTSREHLGKALLELADNLRGPLSEVIQRFVSDAPSEIQCECESMFDQRLYKRCLQRALLWRVEAGESGRNCRYVYIPPGIADDAVQTAAASQFENARSSKKIPQPLEFLGDYDSAEDTENDLSIRAGSQKAFVENIEFAEEIDLPPESTPDRASEGKRPWTDPGSEKDKLDPLLLGTGLATSKTAYKRQRRDKPNPTKDISESISYTRKLERLLHGSEVKDMMLGNGRLLLSAALRGAPPLSPED